MHLQGGLKHAVVSLYLWKCSQEDFVSHLSAYLILKRIWLGGGSGGRQSLTGEKERIIKVEPLFPAQFLCFDRGHSAVGSLGALMCATPGVWVAGWSFADTHTHIYKSVTEYLFWPCLSTNKAKSTGRTYPSSMADNIVSTAAGGLRLTLASLLAGLLSDEAAELAWLALAS